MFIKDNIIRLIASAKKGVDGPEAEVHLIVQAKNVTDKAIAYAAYLSRLHLEEDANRLKFDTPYIFEWRRMEDEDAMCSMSSCEEYTGEVNW